MLKIRLSLYNESGAIAALETADDFDEVSVVCESNNRNAKSICRKAAERLRKAADKFDLLAEQPDPWKCKTQSAVNRGRIKPTTTPPAGGEESK